MAQQIVRTQESIDETLDAASEGVEKGSNYPGMLYEQGIQDMYDWLVGNTEDNPMEIED